MREKADCVFAIIHALSVLATTILHNSKYGLERSLSLKILESGSGSIIGISCCIKVYK